MDSTKEQAMVELFTKTIFLILLITLVSACSPAATAVPLLTTAIPSAVTPTNTALPPTATTVSPTNTPLPLIETPTPEPISLPVFEPSGCNFPYQASVNVNCGYLIVPENRNKSDNPPIRIHVAIFKSSNPNPKPDPVIYVAGGGGVDQLSATDYYLSQVGNAILQQRDFIMFNQRGAYRNEPSLVCPDLTDFSFVVVGRDLTSHEKADLRIEKILECHDDFLARGIDLTAYNTLETAADVKDLWSVLGYDEVNLYGTSSGTRTILTIMRHFPEGIRSVILDSVFPPQANLYSTVSLSADRVLSRMFEDCAAQPECYQEYPDLEATFFQLVDDLNANPINVELSHGAVPITGSMFMDALVFSFFSVEDIALAPRRIELARQGIFTGMEPWFESMLGDSGTFMAMGFEWSMMCNEEVPFESYEEGRALAADLPFQIADYFDSYYEFTLCESWQAGRADQVENTAVVSDIPALVLAGGYDPVTPPEWGRMAAETLRNHFFYEFPGLSHGIMRSNACGLSIGLQFLDDPTSEPDATCISEVPRIIFK
jgi:pimeloyl-ACP methyl ester carboxylesterase